MQWKLCLANKSSLLCLYMPTSCTEITKSCFFFFYFYHIKVDISKIKNLTGFIKGALSPEQKYNDTNVSFCLQFFYCFILRFVLFLFYFFKRMKFYTSFVSLLDFGKPPCQASSLPVLNQDAVDNEDAEPSKR